MLCTVAVTMKKLEGSALEKLSVLNLGGMWLVPLLSFEIPQYGPGIMFSLFHSSSKPTYTGIPVDLTTF